jgi:hypothetical protein
MPSLVHNKIYEHLPSERAIYFKADVHDYGPRTLVFTCYGMVDNESPEDWRKRTKHIDSKLKGTGVKLLSISQEDCEEILRVSNRHADARRRKVYILQQAEVV